MLSAAALVEALEELRAQGRRDSVAEEQQRSNQPRS